MSEQLLLEVRNLKKYFELTGGFLQKTKEVVQAVEDISLEVKRGETLGLVGESGCGKTTTGRVILQLIKGTSGDIYFKGKDLLKLSKKELQKMRPHMQIVFQDPYSSLNPRMTIKNIIAEPLSVNKVVKGQELHSKVLELMHLVGLKDEHLNRYPHEFSGGQRQRIGIARALALNPEFLVLDEPTSSLDVSVQAQILNLLKDLQKELELTYLFISHDLSVIKFMSTRIAVMYAGKIVEIAMKKSLFEEQLHPYTQALFSAIPVPNPHYQKPKIILKGEVPSPINPPSGCRFHPRCPHAMKICEERIPSLINMKNEHFVACHLYSPP